MSKLSDYSRFDHLVDSDDEDVDAPVVSRNQSQSAAFQDNHPNNSSAVEQPQAQIQSEQQQSPPTSYHQKDPVTGRYVFYYGSQKVYEWEQTLDTVTLYIDVPHYQSNDNTNSTSTSTSAIATTAKDLIVRITTKHLQVGLKRHVNQYFLNHDFFSLVDTTESCWFLEDNSRREGIGKRVLQIVLQKQRRGETWDCVLLEPNGTTATTDTNSIVGTNPTVNPLLKQEMQQQLLLERFQEENPGMDFRDATFNGSVPDQERIWEE